MNNSSGNDNDNDDNCPICLYTLQNPLKINCGHIYCTECILNLYSHKILKCPLCNTKIIYYTKNLNSNCCLFIDIIQSYYLFNCKESCINLSIMTWYFIVIFCCIIFIFSILNTIFSLLKSTTDNDSYNYNNDKFLNVHKFGRFR